MRTVRVVAILFAVVAIGGCGNPADQSTIVRDSPPASAAASAAMKTGHMGVEDAFRNIDLQALSGSRTLDGTVRGNTISWEITSIDQKGFEAICSSVGPDVDIEITVALTPVAPEPSPSPDCPGHDPLAVAIAFITAVRADDTPRYEQCVYSGPERDATSMLGIGGWVTTIQEGDYRLDDEFERLRNMFSFGSPDLPACTCSPSVYIDPNGRADVTVTLEPDGLYYVTKLGIEVHA
jgi:hypothetical protein